MTAEREEMEDRNSKGRTEEEEEEKEEGSKKKKKKRRGQMNLGTRCHLEGQEGVERELKMQRERKDK